MQELRTRNTRTAENRENGLKMAIYGVFCAPARVGSHTPSLSISLRVEDLSLSASD